MPRAAIASLAILILGPPSALAEPIRVAPEPCPIPADIAPLVSDDVGAHELNSWDGRFDELLLYKDIPVAEGDLTVRVFPDPETGEVYEFPAGPGECSSDPETAE